MRPASEIHSSLDLVESDLERQDGRVKENLSIVRDVLRWAAGGPWYELHDGYNPWLAAYLLDDPPKLSDVPPEIN